MKTQTQSTFRVIAIWGVLGFFSLVALGGAVVIAMDCGLLPRSVEAAVHELVRDNEEGCG